MERINKSNSNYVERDIKVVQFGEGNFLRGFVDYMIDLANEKGIFNGNVALVKPIEYGSLDLFHQQDCQYTLQLRGLVNGKENVETRKITCCSKAVSPFDDYEEYIALSRLDSLRFVVSNTTEAGIVYHETDSQNEKLNITFPAKLTQFLKERYDTFKGAHDKGLVMLPVELIDDNGIELKKCVQKYMKLWNMEKSFVKWVNEDCIFTSTLVDRIVTGYPRNEKEMLCESFGYDDQLIDTAEPFALWVIESEKDISKEFPMDQALIDKKGMNVIFTDNQKPYKQRKVRILNGAHTSFVLASYLNGQNIVKESMEDDLIREFMLHTIYDEVIPTLSLPKEDLESFAAAVVDRFKNPFINHSLLAISLNSVSKFRARCLPSLLGYFEKKNELPTHLTFSIAALLEFYHSSDLVDGVLKGNRNGEIYDIKDDFEVLKFFESKSNASVEELVIDYLSKVEFHGLDLSKVPNLCEQVILYVKDIRAMSMHGALVKYFGEK